MISRVAVAVVQEVSKILPQDVTRDPRSARILSPPHFERQDRRAAQQYNRKHRDKAARFENFLTLSLSSHLTFALR